MKLWKKAILFLLLFFISPSYYCLYSQNLQTKPTRQSSLEAFSEGNYENAYREFRELLLTYTKDPLYKYYSGVCLVKLNRNPDEAVALLKDALNGAAVVRTLPSDALFYLGRAQQMAGMFTEAAGSYNLYTGQVGKKSAREQGVPDLIQQCIAKKGKIEESEIKSSEVAKNENVVSEKSTDKPEVNDISPKSPDKPASVKTILPDDYDSILDEALKFQFKADSLNTLAGKQKEELEKLSNGEKSALKVKISENEMLAASFQKSADQKFDEAQIAMNPQKKKMPSKEDLPSADYKVVKDSVRPSEKKVAKDSVQQSDKGIMMDSLPQTATNTGKKYEKQPDKIKMADTSSSKQEEVFTYFEILPKPISDPDIKIPIDSDVPEGLIYRIKIAVFRNPVAPSFFKGIIPVYGFKASNSDNTNYYAGMFRKLADANKALAQVKAKGFRDAYVVALSESKPISADRAAILEKEWGTIPFNTSVTKIPETKVAATNVADVAVTVPVAAKATNAADTVPPTLSFRVEVVRSAKPLKKDVIEGIKKVAGSRGLDTQVLDDGNIAYLIGKFITFESAAEFADLLVKNGYSKAQVVARLGKKEIPVETAKQLFENLK